MYQTIKKLFQGFIYALTYHVRQSMVYWFVHNLFYYIMLFVIVTSELCNERLIIIIYVMKG